MSSLTTIFSFVLIAVWVLRIFKLRPHRRANIITFIIQLLCLMVDSNGNLAVSELPSMAIGVAVFTWILHLLAKWHDRRKEKKQQKKMAAKQASTPALQQTGKTSTQTKVVQTQTPPKPKQKKSPVVQQKAPPVQQTLTNCMRCGQPLTGATCSSCGFDHTAQPILLLSPVVPGKLQIRIDQ